MSKKCWGHIVEENKRSTHDYIQEGLLKIGGDSYGNCLVLKVTDGVVGDEIYIWDHETNGLRKSSISFAKIQAKARKRVEGIIEKSTRNMNR